MISAIGIMIVWTWGLTPLWVNVTTTVLLSLRLAAKIGGAVVRFIAECSEEDI